MEDKKIVEIQATVENIDLAKELLKDLEVLEKKYDIVAKINVYKLANVL